MISEIPFSHFFIETKDEMPEWMMKTLNPYNMIFLKLDKIYMAISPIQNKSVTIFSAIGFGLEGFREFIKHCKLQNVETIYFSTKIDNHTAKQIYKYAKAEVINIQDNYYNDGKACINYVINLRNNRRL